VPDMWWSRNINIRLVRLCSDCKFDDALASDGLQYLITGLLRCIC
jgi:hypothetical protein